MPTVRTYGQRQVALAPIPGVRKQASLTAEALGAGTEIAKSRASEEMGQFGATAARIGLQQYAEIREQGFKYQQSVQRLELSNQLSQWKSQRLFTPGTGALAQEGKNSFHLPEEVGAEFDDYTGGLEATISDPETRLWFASQRVQEGAQIDLTLRRHVLGESQKYEAEQTQALKENQANEAIVNALDEPAVIRAINKGVIAIQEHAGRMGQSPDAIKDQVRDYQSAVLTGVISRLISTDQVVTAQDRFKKAKDAGLLDGKALHDLEQDLKTGTTKVESAKLADAILADSQYDTLTKQQDAAKEKAGDNIFLRDATNDRLEHASVLKDKREGEHTENVLGDVYTRLYQNGGDLSKVTAAEVRELGTHIAAVESFAKQRAANADGEPKLNMSTYIGLKNMASSRDPKERQTFMNTVLLGFIDQLPKNEMKELADLQARMRAGDAKVPNVLAGVRSDLDMFKGVLNDAGIDEKTPAANQLYREWQLAVDTQQQGGKELTGSEKQQILDDKWQSIIITPGSMWNFLPGGKPYYDVTKRVADLTFADIPAEEKNQVIQATQQANPGMRVNEQMVLRTWIATRRAQGKGKGYTFVDPSTK